MKSPEKCRYCGSEVIDITDFMGESELEEEINQLGRVRSVSYGGVTTDRSTFHFLLKLVREAELYGNQGDWQAVKDFVRYCFATRGLEPPDLTAKG